MLKLLVNFSFEFREPITVHNSNYVLYSILWKNSFDASFCAIFYSIQHHIYFEKLIKQNTEKLRPSKLAIFSIVPLGVNKNVRVKSNYFAVSPQASIPFSVIGSNTIVEVNGRRVRGRLYPWGIVEGTQPLKLKAHSHHFKIRPSSLPTGTWLEQMVAFWPLHTKITSEAQYKTQF